MKTKQSSSTKRSEPEKVDAYMHDLKHPLADVVQALRQIILKTDSEIGEEIKWNAPTFFYTGEMAPFNPKEYNHRIQSFQEGLYPAGIPERCESRRSLRTFGGRLCRRPAAGAVFKHG
jgi:hypothetical protein